MSDLEVVKVCKVHGELYEKDITRSFEKQKNGNKYLRLRCRKCTFEAAVKKPCKVHGILELSERNRDGSCRICSVNKLIPLNQKRNADRSYFNLKQRIDKEKNPEKWAEYEKAAYQRRKERYGLEEINERQAASRFHISIEQFRQMVIDQEDKCAICGKEETRLATSKSTDRIIAKLSIDHCHKTMKVRGLLCHDCNTGMGKFKENIEVMQKAIDYLIFHNGPPNATEY